MRKSGILMHITSLPGKYACGTLGDEARAFVDFLSESGVACWQVLPVNPTGFGNSPYQSPSTFAGNPYFISPKLLCADGLLHESEAALLESDCRTVDFERLEEHSERLLRLAFSRFEPDEEYGCFKRRRAEWLDDYSLFMAIKRTEGGACWLNWSEDMKMHSSAALAEFERTHRDEVEFWKFVQFEFFTQWGKLKKYANSKGVEHIGDIAIYVSLDSSDVWSAPELFRLDEEHSPVAVAGCPPDYFSADGQLWGNPLYDWDEMKKRGYNWWIERLKAALELFDCTRIDHFRGFAGYWSIPYGDKTAAGGHWEAGPGRELFDALNAALGRPSIIAEDLGLITDDVRELLKYTGFPGMKVLEFAFTKGYESDYLPFNHVKNCVCYTGTHDNDTLIGWLDAMNEDDKAYLYRFTHTDNDRDCASAVIDLAWSSRAELCVVPMQDLLMLDSRARMNTPSTCSGNWLWRMDESADLKSAADELRVRKETFFR